MHFGDLKDWSILIVGAFFSLGEGFISHCVSSPCGLITAVPRWISFSALRFTPDLGWETLSPKPQARDWGLSVNAFHHHVASSLRLPTCCPLLRRRPCAARFCDGAHVLPASATAPTCRPLLRRRPRAARFVGGALCRPLVRRRPLAARFCGGAQWKTLSPKTLSPMPFKNMMKMASWLNCKRFQTKMNSKSQKVSGTW